MKKLFILIILVCSGVILFGQKKVLDSSVYDHWQSIDKVQLSNNGKWLLYNINVQEGNDLLIVQRTDDAYERQIPRGYDAYFTDDNNAVVFKIKPLFKDIRQAKIKKKKPADMPKDSLGIWMLNKDSVVKMPGLMAYKKPKEQNFLLAALFKSEAKATSKREKGKDSLQQIVDSLEFVIGNMKSKDSATDISKNNNLLLINTKTNEHVSFNNVGDYVFDKSGHHILISETLDLADSINSARVVCYNIVSRKADTLLRGGNQIKNLALSDDGSQAAFLAERNANPKALLKEYKLWYYKQGMDSDSAQVLVDTLSPNFPKGNTVSEFAKISFSKSGSRLLFGIAPIRPAKDTSLAEIDKVNLDVWSYNDDYLQPYQLENLKRNIESSYAAVYDFEQKKMTPLGSKGLPNVDEFSESDFKYFLATTDTGRRVASQWTGSTIKDVYQISVTENKTIPVIKNLDGIITTSWCSPSGKYIIWYNNKDRNYYSFDGTATHNITSKISVPLYKEDNDTPDDPAPYGVMGWSQHEQYLYIYDRYDIWKVYPSGKIAPENITKTGRKTKITYRYVTLDLEEKYINNAEKSLLSYFNNINKKSGLAMLEKDQVLSNILIPTWFNNQPYSFDGITKAKDAFVFAYTKENYEQSPNVFVYKNNTEKKYSNINPQQANYNWGTAKLYFWKTFSGKPATGILYTPENFDSTKKYPVILYFYEKLSDNLYKYMPPAPTPSRLNISFFTSRGYIILTPDISYTIGHPAQSAYDYIVSGAKDLAKHSWVDAKHIGIQGQSWGGIQVAQLITMTNMFAAAWAGAPVANMTSAYGGIRWKGGVNRQFQYEKTQSRIGATLWSKPQLYIENSPLFHVQKVTTPLVIMANDNDGAVPWYQGIELFTAMRRLDKKVWMLNYNGEEHNLVQRKNRKDISIREQQFFDWLLKNEKPPEWLINGVPAIKKGIDWGLKEAQ